VFTFVVPKYWSAASQVTIEIVPLDGGCELTLTHEGVLSEHAERGAEGWSTILAGLAAVA
jgi:Activator of Hsp90 ATPase homolog 1-like protein